MPTGRWDNLGQDSSGQDDEDGGGRWSNLGKRKGKLERAQAAVGRGALRVLGDPGRTIYSGGHLMDVLDTIAAGSYAVGGLYKGAVERAQELGGGQNVGISDVAKYLASRKALESMKKGVSERASSREAITAANPEFEKRHPLLTSAMGFGLDVGSDPANLIPGMLATKVGKATVGAGKRTALGAARRIAPETTRGVAEWQRTRNLVRAGRAQEELGRAAIVKTTERVVPEEILPRTQDIAETAGAATPNTWRAGPSRRQAGKVARTARQAAEQAQTQVTKEQRGLARFDRVGLAAAKKPIDQGVMLKSRAAGLRSGAKAARDAAASIPIEDVTGRVTSIRDQIRAVDTELVGLRSQERQLARQAAERSQAAEGIVQAVAGPEHALTGAESLPMMQRRLDDVVATGRKTLRKQPFDAEAELNRVRAQIAEKSAHKAALVYHGQEFRIQGVEAGKAGTRYGHLVDRDLKLSQKALALDQAGDAAIATAMPGYQKALARRKFFENRVAAAENAAKQAATRALHRRWQVEQIKGMQIVKGAVPASRRGLAFDIPAAGTKATSQDVDKLVTAYAEGASPSGLARTPQEARQEVLAAAQSLGLDKDKFLGLADWHIAQGTRYQPRMIASGMKSEEELMREARAGGYIRRTYESKELTTDEAIQRLKDQGRWDEAYKLQATEANRVPMGGGDRANINTRLFSERQNLPPQMRRKLGEITEGSSRQLAQGDALSQTLPRFEMYKSFADDPRLAIDPATLGTADKRVLESQGWLAMPDQTTAPEGSWGALAGKWVAPVLHDSLVGHSLNWNRLASKSGLDEAKKWLRAMAAPSLSREKPGAHGIAAGVAKTTGALKRGWTIWNVASQARNMAGNAVAMHAFAGVPLPLVPVQYLRGFLHAAHDTPFFKMMTANMASLADPMVSRELQADLRAIRTGQKAGVIQRVGKAVGTPLGKWWQLNEAAAKIGAAEYLMGRGMPMQAAVKAAESALYHYGDVARVIEKLRTYGPIPFPTYALKTAEQFTKTALTNPQRINVWTRAGQNLERAGATPEQVEGQRGLLADYEQNNLPVRLPITDAKKRNIFLRTGYTLPWGAVGGGGEMLAAPFSGRTLPALDPLIDLARNRNWQDRPIRDVAAPASQQAGEVAKHLIRGYMPMGAIAARVGQAVFGSKKEKQTALTPVENLSSIIGASLAVQDIPTAKRNRAYGLQQESKDLITWASKRVRNTGRPLTREEKEHVAARLIEIRAKAKKLGLDLRAAGTPLVETNKAGKWDNLGVGGAE